MAVSAGGQQGADFIANLCAFDTVFLQDNMDIAAAVRLNRKAAILGNGDRTRKAVVRGGDFNHLAFGAAFHTGAVEQFDEDFILRHCAVQRAAGDKDIAGAIVPCCEAKPGRKFDQCAGDGCGGGLVFHCGQARGIPPVLRSQQAKGHHPRYSTAQPAVIHLQVVLQFAQRVRAPLDGGQNVLLQLCHCILLPNVALPPGRALPACGAQHPGRRSYFPMVHPIQCKAG